MRDAEVIVLAASDAQSPNIASAFEQQAAKTPDAPAFLTEKRTITYRELDDLATAIAGDIQAAAAADSSPVALLVEDSLACIAAMLGAAKSARIFVPLDPSFPEIYLAGTIADSGASLILADRATAKLANTLAGSHAQVCEIDWDRKTATSRSALHRRPAHIEPISCIIYTSGSTGRPKGVIYPHALIIRNRDVGSGTLGLGTGDRIGLLLPITWASGINNGFTALLSGACVCPFSVGVKGLGALSKWLKDNDITILMATSSLFRTWVASLSPGQHFPHLRFVRGGAEPLYGEDVARVKPHLAPGCRLAHSFGSTELGSVTVHTVDLATAPESGILPVGYPTEGVEIRIEAAPGVMVGPGEVGEIVLRSRALALGYWKQPELTNAVFSTDPRDASMRIFRTGDLGRWRTDGMLEHLGRTDSKIKLLGRTIELHEVQRALLRQSEIRDAVVLFYKRDTVDGRLVAYVVGPKDRSAESIRSIVSGLSAQLPAHMVPSEIIVLESMPLTSRGKVDRNALPPPSALGQERAYRAPSSELEGALAAIWQDVLKIPKIGVEADFYELGGTSLQAFLIFARIATTLGRDLPPTSMVGAHTIGQQAALLRETPDKSDGKRLVPFRTTGRGSPLFIVHGAGGDIMFARELAKHLRSDRPIYGLQPAPLDGAHRVPRRLQRIAATYLSEIRKVQPTGPYCLAGFSFGGAVALEMAQQLARTGESVAFLGIIDANYDARYVIAGEKLASRIGRHARTLRGQRMLNYLNTRAAKTLNYYYRLARERIKQLPNELRYAFGRPIPYEERVLFYNRIHFRASRHYSRRPYPGAIAMFVRDGAVEWHRERWLPLALGGLTLHEIPAGHMEMVSPPHSITLAEGFDAYLDGVS